MKYVDLSCKGKVKEKILYKIDKILSSGQYILGSEVCKFEQSICDYLDSKYCVSVNSGYDALVLSLLASSIKSGDEVITVANTFPATVSAIEAVNAIPVFVDVDNSRNISVENIKSKITNKTKAIIPVHLSGIPCNMKALMELAKEKSLVVVEDAAQAFGTSLNNQFLGTFGLCGCFSLHPTKILGACGDGGVIVTDNQVVFEKLKLLRNHGLLNREEFVCIGMNSRLDEIQACILNEKMNTIDKVIEYRRRIANIYTERLDSRYLCTPEIPNNTRISFFTYTVQINCRDALKEYLLENGIDTRVHYPKPINMQKAYYDKHGQVKLVNTEKQAGKILSLPCNEKMQEEDAVRISDLINSFFNNEYEPSAFIDS